MTCKEKLAIEHPEEMCKPFGNIGCPNHYGYMERPEYCGEKGMIGCRQCWDRALNELEGVKT